MSIGAQIDKFYLEVGENKVLWFAEDKDGVALEFDVANDKVTFPVWSSKSRIMRLRKLSPELLDDFRPISMTWSEFKEKVLPQLKEQDRLISLNLSGKNLRGFDLRLEQVVKNIESATGAS